MKIIRFSFVRFDSIMVNRWLKFEREIWAEGISCGSREILVGREW